MEQFPICNIRHVFFRKWPLSHPAGIENLATETCIVGPRARLTKGRAASIPRRRLAVTYLAEEAMFLPESSSFDRPRGP